MACREPERRSSHTAREVDEHGALSKLKVSADLAELVERDEADVPEVGGKVRPHGMVLPNTPERRRRWYGFVYGVVSRSDDLFRLFIQDAAPNIVATISCAPSAVERRERDNFDAEQRFRIQHR